MELEHPPQREQIDAFDALFRPPGRLTLLTDLTDKLRVGRKKINWLVWVQTEGMTEEAAGSLGNGKDAGVKN